MDPLDEYGSNHTLCIDSISLPMPNVIRPFYGHLMVGKAVNIMERVGVGKSLINAYLHNLLIIIINGK